MGQPVVEVLVVVYNHAPYLRQALDSIIAQEASFDVRITIADDCSTDGSIDILKEYKHRYGDKVNLILQSVNLGPWHPERNIITMLKNATGKYVAMLDGDDYWCDNLKLQRQVDFLENNKEYSVCGTDARIFQENKKEFATDTLNSKIAQKEFTHEEISIRNRMITPTVVFRNLVGVKKLLPLMVESPYGDWMLYAILTKFGKAINLDIVTAVYRQHGGGIFSGASSLKTDLNHVLMYRSIIQHLGAKGESLLQYYHKHAFHVFSETKDRKLKKEMLRDYMFPFRFSLFFDRTFISMCRRVLFSTN